MLRPPTSKPSSISRACVHARRSGFCARLCGHRRRAARQSALQDRVGRVLKGAGRFDEAERQLRQALTAHGPHRRCARLLAQLLQETGRLAEAEHEALIAAMAMPEDAEIIETLWQSCWRAAARTMRCLTSRRGAPGTARPELDRLRGHCGAAARTRVLPRTLRVRSAGAQLHARAPAGLVIDGRAERRAARCADCASPLREPSFWIRACGAAVETTRNLIAESDASIRAVLQAFQAPIADYLRALRPGAGASAVSARNVGGAVIAGAWSVQLHREGFHVNHLHPQGWISSAYYVDVPDEARIRRCVQAG